MSTTLTANQMIILATMRLLDATSPDRKALFVGLEDLAPAPDLASNEIELNDEIPAMLDAGIVNVHLGNPGDIDDKSLLYRDSFGDAYTSISES